MHTNHRITVFILVCLLAPSTLFAVIIEPLVRAGDLDVGETRQVKLHDGSMATVTLLELTEKRDSVRNAVRKAQVKVKVNGQRISEPYAIDEGDKILIGDYTLMLKVEDQSEKVDPFTCQGRPENSAYSTILNLNFFTAIEYSGK